MSDDVAVLFANDAFYAAFLGRDCEAMDAVWSHHPLVTCIHPGWPPLIGRDEVMRSWEAILTGPHPPNIRCQQARANLLGAAAAYVLCYERLENGLLAATNVFIREGPTWKMVHHQAGAAPPAPDMEEEAPNERLQ